MITIMRNMTDCLFKWSGRSQNVHGDGEKPEEIIRKGYSGLRICLGNQLMALASGADTYKLKYGTGAITSRL
jgi:carbamoylphosphate synthase small subunit